MSQRLPLDYVLPLRWSDDADADELTHYLAELSRHVHVHVVDGSPDELFAVHAERWGGMVDHLPPDARFTSINGKVDGVHTGMSRCTWDAVVIADDDVRYRRDELIPLLDLLADHDLVRPQNFFSPAPWHARWDMSRSLLNRLVSADWPGTFGIRRSTFEAMGGYDGDVLFENLELVRTVEAAGGCQHIAHDLYVRRVPCDTRQFFGQRVRQAYDDVAQPGRLVAEMSVLPLVVGALATRRRAPVVAALVAVVVAAEAGRRRAGGRAVFPPDIPLWAPLWVMERALCVWVAMGQRVTSGGVRYRGRRLSVAAHSAAQLQKRAVARRGGLRRARQVPSRAGSEPGELVSSVAERLA